MQNNLTGIRCGDCKELLPCVPAGSVRLVFADPPFNLGRQYDSYSDRLSDEEYINWLAEWINMVKPVLTPDGSFWLAITEKYVAEAKLACCEAGFHLRNWIVWHYTFGQNMRTQFSRSNTHILYFINDQREFVFNDMQVRIPSYRQLEYGDKRAHPDGKVPDATWDSFPRVCGTFRAKKEGHDNQMPEQLLQRIVRTASHPGDVVLDPFSGTGTTAVAAARLGRSYTAFDISEEYCESAKSRLSDAVEDPENTIAAAGKWGAFHMETAEQFLREAGVNSAKLMYNEDVLSCFARLLNIRCGGAAYTADEVAEILPAIERRISSSARLR